MAEAVYLLCMLTSAGCALVLLRTYLRRGSPILLWSSVCFTMLALNNALLVLDLIVFPAMDLAAWRAAVAAVAMLVLAMALIWEAE
jgi:hypothetical protein